MTIPESDIPAGDFAEWLEALTQSLHHDREMDVPCGSCDVCCRSFQFIHVRPEEHEALARIPKELLFPAPGMAKGHWLMGYDDQGCCPMMGEEGCQIYKHRPLTCRLYDCRVLAAAGLTEGDPQQAPLLEHSRRWRFEYKTEEDRQRHQAVQAAARFIRDHAAAFPGGRIPAQPAQLAILAIKVHQVFLPYVDGQRLPAEAEVVRAVVEINNAFEES